MRLLLLFLFIFSSICYAGIGSSQKPKEEGVNIFKAIGDLIAPENNSELDNDNNNDNKSIKKTIDIYPTDIKDSTEVFSPPGNPFTELDGDSYPGCSSCFKEAPKGELIEIFYDLDTPITNIVTFTDPKIDKISKYCHDYKQSKVNEMETVCTNTYNRGKVCSSYKTGGGYQPAEKEQEIDTQNENELNLNQNKKEYLTNTEYFFITQSVNKIIFKKTKQTDKKIDIKFNDTGRLDIYLNAEQDITYYETPLYVFYNVYAKNNCVQRQILKFFYDEKNLNEIKKEKIILSPNYYAAESIEIYWGDSLETYYDEYQNVIDMNDLIMNSSEQNKNIIIKCPSCVEEKKYSLDIDIVGYQQKYKEKEKIKKQKIFDQKTSPYKKQCEEIGFIPETDKFKNCVLELMN